MRAPELRDLLLRGGPPGEKQETRGGANPSLTSENRRGTVPMSQAIDYPSTSSLAVGAAASFLTTPDGGGCGVADVCYFA